MTSCSDIQEKKCILHTFWKDNNMLQFIFIFSVMQVINMKTNLHWFIMHNLPKDGLFPAFGLSCCEVKLVQLVFVSCISFYSDISRWLMHQAEFTSITVKHRFWYIIMTHLLHSFFIMCVHSYKLIQISLLQ